MKRLVALVSIHQVKQSLTTVVMYQNQFNVKLPIGFINPPKIHICLVNPVIPFPGLGLTSLNNGILS